MKINYFKNGAENKISLKGSQIEKLMPLLKKLISDVDDEARLIVDNERISNIKKSDEVLEIILDQAIKFTSKRFKDYEIKKILIPVTGELSTTENEKSVVLLLGNKIYDSNPYINSNGAQNLKDILGIIK